MIVKVSMDVEDMKGKSVLVFLKPMRPQTNLRVHAWQEIKASAGAVSFFDFEPVVSCDLTTPGVSTHTLPAINPSIWNAPTTQTLRDVNVNEDSTKTIISKSVVVEQGELLLATNSYANLSPTLQLAPIGMAKDRLTPRQYGIYNQTYPHTEVDCNWRIHNSLVVTMPGIDWGMTCSFEYEPIFYFMVAAPLLQGNNYTVQAFTCMTAHPISSSCTLLSVKATKNQNRWGFDFTEV